MVRISDYLTGVRLSSSLHFFVFLCFVIIDRIPVAICQKTSSSHFRDWPIRPVDLQCDSIRFIRFALSAARHSSGNWIVMHELCTLIERNNRALFDAKIPRPAASFWISGSFSSRVLRIVRAPFESSVLRRLSVDCSAVGALVVRLQADCPRFE